MKVFVQGNMVCIDVVMPDGRAQISRESLEQIQMRYPGAAIADLAEWTAAKEKALCTEPAEITEERFMEMLEVLPPQRWHRAHSVDGVFCQSFELSEHLSGRVTSIYCQVGEKFFEWCGIAGAPLEAHFVHCGGLRAEKEVA